jgi:hypothetical protein
VSYEKTVVSYIMKKLFWMKQLEKAYLSICIEIAMNISTKITHLEKQKPKVGFNAL